MSANERRRGVVYGYDIVKRYGFINPDDGTGSLFVGGHALRSSGIEILHKGDVVTFRTATARSGKPECVSLEILTSSGGASWCRSD
jgi:cold shock CspA family protein